MDRPFGRCTPRLIFGFGSEDPPRCPGARIIRIGAGSEDPPRCPGARIIRFFRGRELIKQIINLCIFSQKVVLKKN